MELPYRIETKAAFRVTGKQLQTTNQKRQGQKAVVEFWKTNQAVVSTSLVKHMGNAHPGIFGVSKYNIDPKDARAFTYLIGIDSDDEYQDDVTYEIPETTWAIFPCSLETMGKTQVQAITKWLPKSNYTACNKGYISRRMKSKAVDIEYYGNDGYAEIWVAVELR